MDRRRLLASIGVCVLVASTAYGARQLAEHETAVDAVQNDREGLPDQHEAYRIHEDIITTVFWVGENADTSNDFIHNRSSAWALDWVQQFGGVDDPSDRCGYKPCGFEPKENPFYFALPFGDYDGDGLKPASVLEVVPWYDVSVAPGESILKNRWIEITYHDKKVYAQWEDVGPFADDDAGYVFGADDPKESRAGLDVSPAVADYLGFSGRAQVSWRFVDDSEVSYGPWSDVVTTSAPQW